MDEITVGRELVGKQVQNAARPEWGVGQVLRVQATRIDGRPAQRVSVQFRIGHRTMVVPPARLVLPHEEPQRESGWLDRVGNRSLDDRLRSLPEHVSEAFGTPRERLAAVLPLYAIDEENERLLRWAREQTGVADPLTQWTRDELLVALRAFCNERDAFVRNLAAKLVMSDGREALDEVLASAPEPIRAGVREALSRPI